LLAEGEPTNEERNGDVGEGGEFAGDGVALDREFAGGHQDGDTGGGDLFGPVEETLEDGDYKGGGFAGASDSASDNITAKEGNRDRFALDWGRSCEGAGSKTAQNRTRE